MVKVKRIISAGWQHDGKTIEDRINEFLADKNPAQIINIKMDFGRGAEDDYVAAYIYYTPDK